MRDSAPPAVCPASASSDAEFMNQPAAPFDTVKPTFEARPMIVILLPRSPCACGSYE